uniref:Uncharacterized protein n=1 Tax=Anopheles maculatus TaxID=74869 RepID=A0A182SH12_9DIPT
SNGQHTGPHANHSWHSWLRSSLNSIGGGGPAGSRQQRIADRVGDNLRGDSGDADDSGGTGGADNDGGGTGGVEGDAGPLPRFGSRWDECNVLEEASTDITTVDEYGKFDFQVSRRRLTLPTICPCAVCVESA